MATRLQGMGVKPDKMVSSPATRTLLTAGYFAEALNMDPDATLVDDRVYLAAVSTLFEVIRDWEDEWETVLLFGHNPTITDFANLHNKGSIDNVPTCGICKFEANIKRWSEWSKEKATLTHFMYPKQYFV